MYTTQTRVPTQKARSYMRQLCKHWSHRFTVTSDEQQGDIAFSDTQQVHLEASDEALFIRIQDSAQADSLEKLEQVVAAHIQKFAFKEQLQFVWAQPESV